MLQIVTPGMIKISILLLYLRLFSASRTLKRAIYGLVAFVAAYILAFELSLGFSCKPVKSLFRPELRRKCINIKNHVLAQACINVISDVLVLLVPIPTILRLKLGGRQKIATVLIFAIASM
jgi:chromate transport protein ChrA